VLLDKPRDNTRHSAGSLVDYESQKIRRTTLSTTVAELYSLMKCFGACQFIRGLWMDISGEASPIHMRGANDADWHKPLLVTIQKYITRNKRTRSQEGFNVRKTLGQQSRNAKRGHGEFRFLRHLASIEGSTREEVSSQPPPAEQSRSHGQDVPGVIYVDLEADPDREISPTVATTQTQPSEPPPVLCQMCKRRPRAQHHRLHQQCQMNPRMLHHA
jgi:hypothetical protein